MYYPKEVLARNSNLVLFEMITTPMYYLSNLISTPIILVLESAQ